MISLIKGQKIDNQFSKYMSKEDGLKMLTSSPMFGFVTLNNIAQEELQSFQGVLEIAYLVVEHIPFLIFKFENDLCFDSAIFNLEAETKEENALNLILIENVDYSVVESRMLGLNPEIIQRLIDDTMKIPYTNEEFLKKGAELQNKYQILELFEMAFLKQAFLGL